MNEERVSPNAMGATLTRLIQGLDIETSAEVLALGCAGCHAASEVALIGSGAGGAPLCIECFARSVAEQAHREGFELGKAAGAGRTPPDECPDCEEGQAIKEHCALCEAPIFETCKRCNGTGRLSAETGATS
jgi:hypothetical protein